MDLYAENILDHYKHPHHSGTLADATISHQEKNLSCGDDLTIDLKIADKKVIHIAWRGTGCAISQAAMSMLSEEILGKTTSAIEEMPADAVQALLGVPIGTRREKCAYLGLHTLKNALRKVKNEPLLPWRETVKIDK